MKPQADGIEIAPGVRISDDLLRFSYTSSSGPGGQNVNKRATKAELRVLLGALPISSRARHRLSLLAARRINDDGDLIITADEHRSQGQNRSECLERLRELLVAAIAEPKVRRKTRPSRGSVERRLTDKSRKSERKRTRRSRED